MLLAKKIGKTKKINENKFKKIYSKSKNLFGN